MVVSRRDDHRDQEISDEVPNKNINGRDSSNSIDGGSVSDTKQEKVETANQKHALSERERRKRINSHYDSLRQLFPGLIKTDKASVLTETVQRLKKLKNMVEDIMTSHEDEDGCSMSQQIFIPSENDEVSISYHDNGNKPFVRVTICCEDRPNLNQDLTKAIQWAHGKAVMAEMATVGRRTKVDIVVEWSQCRNKEEDIGLLRRALKDVVENQILGRAKLMGMGRGSIETEFFELGQRLADSIRPNVCDET